MSPRNLLNAGLALVLTGLIIFVVYEPGKEKPLEKIKLTPLTPSSINKIIIEQKQSPRIILQKEQNQWRMVEPYAYDANNQRIKTLLAISSTSSQSQYAAAAVNLQQLKLSPPGFTLTLDNTQLVFGTTDAIKGYRYVQIKDKVHLIVDRFSHLMTGEATTLLSPALLPGNANISKLVLPELTLQSKESGWQLSPENKMTSSDGIQQLLDEWRHSRAIRLSKLIAEIDNKTDGLIEVTLSDDQQLRFTVIRTEDEIIFARHDLGLRYHFTTETGERLLKLGTTNTSQSAVSS